MPASKSKSEKNQSLRDPYEVLGVNRNFTDHETKTAYRKLALRSRTAVAPLERLKILLQVQNPHSIKYNGAILGLKYIWRREGFRGMFKGNGTNYALIVPNSLVKFFSYKEASK